MIQTKKISGPQQSATPDRRGATPPGELWR
jgi:hypothetical protein